MKAGRATLAAAPVTAGLFIAVLAGGTAAGNVETTSVRTVSPVDAAGHLKAGYKVLRRLGDATCQSGSFMTGVADRCATPSSGAVVLDPCWPTAQATTFVCMAEPWRHQVVALHVTTPLASGSQPHANRLPWGMQLGAKVRCLLDPGSVRRLYGHALLFHCSRNRDVFGPLRREGAHWMAHVYRAGASTSSGYAALGWQPVDIAWYGTAIVAPTTPTPTATPSASPTDTTSPSPTQTSMAAPDRDAAPTS